LSILRGAPFIVNLRLEWIKTFGELSRVPAVAQFIGLRDAEVGVEDSEDILSLPNAYRLEPFPGLDHDSILEARACYVALRQFLDHSTQRTISAPKKMVLEGATEGVVKVLVMHGIRDYGERFLGWIKPGLERRATDLGKRALIRAPRYKYFSALDFLLPWTRELRVQKFVDEYAELLAERPHDASIHFVGHSFGTYQLGDALKKYNQVRFGRIFLVGSVLDEDFGWGMYLGPGRSRVVALCNTAASYDWPVGLLCEGIRFLRLSDLIGTGGYNGFALDSQELVQVRYYRSWAGHGAAIQGEENLLTIVDWVFNQTEGQAPFERQRTLSRLKKAGVIGERPALLTFLHRWFPAALAVAVVVLLVSPWILAGLSIWNSFGALLGISLLMRYL